jgi:hypothetical protein
MIRGHWLAAAASVALLTITGRGAAQESKYNLSLQENVRWDALRQGKKQVSDGEKAQNEAVIRRVAQIQVNKMLQAAEQGFGSSESNSISEAVRHAGEIFIDPLNLARPLSLSEFELNNIFAHEVDTQLMKLLGTPEKPSGAEILIKINAARMMSIVARAGYEGIAEDIITVLNDPKQSDAVKLYMLQALRHLFAVPHREKGANFSVFSKPEAEAKAIQTLIDFITRKPALSADAPKQEVDAYRYLRREAVRALGLVRKPIVKIDDKIVSVPALWLLRVANGDKNLVPAPSLSERVEGLVGYLQLSPDRDLNMDFAAGFVAAAVVDIARDYKDRKPLAKPAAGAAVPAGPAAEERDWLPWKLTANRMSLGLITWRKNWDEALPAAAKPDDVKRIVNGVVDGAESDFLKVVLSSGPNESVTADNGSLKKLLETPGAFKNNLLLSNDKNSFVTRPDR